jgi:hypothetical protein
MLTPSAASILHAVLAMGGLTLVMFVWMIATRLPAMQRLGMKPQDGAHTAELRARLPPEIRRVGDNYNHLFEAPTAFYAVALAIVALGQADALHAACAWVFFVCRVGHSIVQASVNYVPLRFSLFGLSMAALSIMIVRALAASF